MPDHYDANQIAIDLGECRQRGLDWLDRRSSNQMPVQAAALQQLAEEYVQVRRRVAAGRIAQIKILLRDGIDELSRQGHTTDARLLSDLFFGDSIQDAIKPPGELLRIARERIGDSESRFRERRANVMRSFAQFLITFAASAARRSDDVVQYDTPEEYRQPATMGYVRDREHFIQLLADAVNVTIIGITNERLTPMLQEALRRKRASGRTDAFWGSLRVVFLGKDLLATVNDDREEFNDSREALRQRLQGAVGARRWVWVFLRRTHSTRWTLYEFPYLPTLTGALFDFGDQRKKIVHLLMKRPRRPTADHLYVELEDLEDQYFTALFEDIIRHSVPINMIVPVGVPTDSTFRCTGVRLLSNVLRDGSEANDWLPMILVVTSQRRDGHKEPILQLRTEDNSDRELNRLSHISGHIIRDDLLLPPGLALADAPTTFHLGHDIPMRAAQRLVQEVTGDDPASALRPMATGSYLYPDKEHLFFFILALDLQEGVQLPRRAEMHSFPLPELLAIRANQVLRSAARLCLTTGVSERAWAAAIEVVTLNLSLHDHDELGEQMRSLSSRQTKALAAIAADIRQLVTERTTPSWASASREVPLMGLAGWQYREFFSVLLPLYAEVGIDGARDLLIAVGADERKRAALSRLAEIYHDPRLMDLMPIEL